jgi:hypothetical protein
MEHKQESTSRKHMFVLRDDDADEGEEAAHVNHEETHKHINQYAKEDEWKLACPVAEP